MKFDIATKIKRKGKFLIDKDIVTIEIPFINFSGNEDIGYLQVHKNVKDEVINIFNEIKELGFPIFNMVTIDKYDYDDKKSVVSNNSSGYNFRFVNGSTKLSNHAIGLAIDINPKQNPWLHPSALNIFPYVPVIEYIHKKSPLCSEDLVVINKLIRDDSYINVLSNLGDLDLDL